MKCLSYEEFFDIMNCLLTDGAENTDMTLVHVISTTNSEKLCGYGDMTMKPGRYLLVWDTTNENDLRWSTMYAYINSHSDFEQYDNIIRDDCKFDILLPNDEDDDRCVCVFKLTEE